jgi:hypothetical protein
MNRTTTFRFSTRILNGDLQFFLILLQINNIMKKTLRIFCLLICVLAFQRCKKEIINEAKIIPSSTSIQEGMIELGEELEDPYSIKNIQKAYTRLKSIDSTVYEIDLKPNKKYIRFLPKTDEEFQLLKDDTTLILYDFPLNFEVLKMGDYYHDPSIPENEITWQYCVVDIEKTLPNIKYELLYEVFIPSDLEEDKEKSIHLSTEFLDKLENESLKITGNYSTTKEEKASAKWTPSGKILFNDKVLGKNLPLEGVKVVVNYFTDDAEGQTNINGEFTVDEKFKTKHKVNCKIKWENKHWDIRSGGVGQAYYDGGKLSSSQKLEKIFSTEDGIQYNYANTHRACYEYFYYAYKYGLTPPPANSFWNAALKIGVFKAADKEINGITHPWTRLFGGINVIRTYNPSGRVDIVYATVIHELAHYAHWGFDKSTFNSHNESNGTLNVAESWAGGVEWVITKNIYPNYVNSYDKTYTGIVEDLIDPIYGKDNVTGYTLSQIEQSLRGAKNSKIWMENLKNKYDNIYEKNLDALFAIWF